MSDYSPKQVAQALQVSESSVKRWCDRGLIETHKTAGGHRRISAASLNAFLELRQRKQDALGIGLVAEEHNSSKDYPRILNSASVVRETSYLSLRDRLLQALLHNDEQGARTIFMQLYSLTGSMAELADDLIAPCFRTIGEMWQRGEVSVYEERRAITTVAGLLFEHRRMFPRLAKDARVAVGGTPSGDEYQLPSMLVETVLLQNNIHATNLGTNLPFATIAEAATDLRADFVWVSFSSPINNTASSDAIQSLRREIPSDTTLLLGGRSASELSIEGMRNTIKFDRLKELEEFAQQIAPITLNRYSTRQS